MENTACDGWTDSQATEDRNLPGLEMATHHASKKPSTHVGGLSARLSVWGFRPRWKRRRPRAAGTLEFLRRLFLGHKAAGPLGGSAVYLTVCPSFRL